MLRNYYINKEWIVSSLARSVYRGAAIFSFGLFLAIVAVRSHAIPEAVLPILKLPILAGVVGAAVTMVGMEYFLFGFDTSSSMKKVFWFCLMLFPLLGPPLYCFVVYSRSDVLKACAGHEFTSGHSSLK
jgi:hypothetical protein